jgi:hypothetical protein
MLSLQRVVLSGNQFSGHIPLSITRLVELRALFLSGNAFVGGIPPQIGDLSNLEQLYLNSNRLSTYERTVLLLLTIQYSFCVHY